MGLKDFRRTYVQKIRIPSVCQGVVTQERISTHAGIISYVVRTTGIDEFGQGL